jgi:endonuclease/exonuclease/phosphatase family metal-dependent hydrolase
MEIRIYSHNVRYATNHRAKGELPWAERKPLVASSILFNARNDAVVGLQEVLPNQLVEILAELGPYWKHAGVGRNDEVPDENEAAPIIYNSKVWDLVTTKTYWLSETPDIPSRGWDAVLNRIVTWARLKNRASKQEINVLNTHFDHVGDIARQESAKFIIRLAEQVGDYPTVLMGDFNMTPDHPGYDILAGAFTDSGTHLPKEETYGHWNTYTGFEDGDSSRIDYIFAIKGFTVQTYGVLHSYFKKVKFSDHRPIVSDLLIE